MGGTGGAYIALQGGYILSSLREERLGEKGGAFLKGKEGRGDFRKILLYLKRNVAIR